MFPSALGSTKLLFASISETKNKHIFFFNTKNVTC